ncbi:hypothetical protein ALC57_15126, partial [Trachymyrmex cornetzi]
SYNFDKTISVDTNGVQISGDRNRCGTNVLRRNCDWRYPRQPHRSASCYVDQSPTPSKVLILDLVIKFVEIRDVDNVKLSLCNKCMYMKPSTILLCLNSTQCVEHIYFDFCQYTNSISDKFKYFVSYLHQNCIANLKW